MNHLGLFRSSKKHQLFFKNLANLLQSAKIKRTFLTDNYYCYDQWDKFLLSDIVKKVGPLNTFSNELNSKLNNKELITPLDMDLLAAKMVHVNNFQELEYIENIFSGFRKTQPAIFVRESMHYSFIRSYIDLNQTDRLLQILKLKYKYGIFLDSYTANMLMDTYLKQDETEKAALVAHEIMLQENDENPLTLAACLLSCLKWTSKIGPGGDRVQEDETDASGDQKKKLLVYFLRKSYNDDHFDLKSMRQLSGKTIYFASRHGGLSDQELANNLQIYGLLLLKKYDKVGDLLEAKKILKVPQILLDELKLSAEEVGKNEELAKTNEKFLQTWNKVSSQLVADSTIDVIKQVQAHLDSLKDNQTKTDISKQTSLFSQWTSEQENELRSQIKNIEIDVKKKSILERLDDLERQEDRLTFFDRQEEIVRHYDGMGFPPENPADIPIEPDESAFALRAERHFKPWPKYKNRPKPDIHKERERAADLESLRTIYLKKDD